MTNPFSTEVIETDSHEAVVLCLKYNDNIFSAVAVSFESFCNRRLKGNDDVILFHIGLSKDKKFFSLVIPYVMFVIDNPYYNG